MPWYAWALIAPYALNLILTIALIGRPREPYTPTLAVVTCVTSALYTWAVVALANA